MGVAGGPIFLLFFEPGPFSPIFDAGRCLDPCFPALARPLFCFVLEGCRRNRLFLV